METKEEKKELTDFTWDLNDSGSLDSFGKEESGETVLTEEEKQQIREDAKNEAKTEKNTEEDSSSKSDNSEDSEKETKDGVKKSEKVDEEVNSESDSSSSSVSNTKDTKKEDSDSDKEKKEQEINFDDTTTKEEEENQDDEFFKNLADGLKEQGIFVAVEIPEGNITEEEFIKLQEDEIEARIDDTFEGFFAEMDDDGKAFLKFKKEGGSTREFFDVLKNTSAIPEGDITDEDYQLKIIRHYSAVIDEMDEDEISERIQWLEETGKSEKYAVKYDGKLKAIEKKEKEALITKKQKETTAKDKQEIKYKTDLKAAMDAAESIKSIPISKEEKSALYDYITKPSVRIGKNNYITGFQEGLQKMGGNFDSMILLAKLIKSDFDLSSLDVKAQTKQVKKLRNTLERIKKTTKPTTAKGSSNRELASYF